MENEVIETKTETTCDNTISTKEVLIKGALIPAMGVVVTQVMPYLAKKVSTRVKARREAQVAEEANA